jgi:prevent-host-death family protein
MTTLTSRELNQDIGRAKREAKKGPVFITDRGKPAHVLLSIEEYERLTKPRRTLAEALYMPGMADIDIDFERPRTPSSLRIPDFDMD